jgi:hypothetical protein
MAPFMIMALLIGGLTSAGHLIRSHSGTPIILFVIIVLVFSKSVKIKKLIFLGILLSGFLIPQIIFKSIIRSRDTFLTQVNAGASYERNVHAFWHSIYIGLGYLKNGYGLNYSDQVAYDKAAEVNPNIKILTNEYEALIKSETIKFIKEHPLFVAKTVIVKGLVLIGYFLIFCNLGFWIILKKKFDSLDWGFIGGLLFCSLTGFLVVPHPKYMLGFISFSILYGCISYGLSIDKKRGFAT